MITESERVQIRKYLGAGSLFYQLFPKLEAAITMIQSKVDGGAQADSSTEASVRDYITKLQSIEAKLEALHCQVQVIQAGKDEVTLNPAQGFYLLRNEGRRFIAVLSRTLDCAPLHDFFSPVAPNASGFPYSHGDY